jgi:peptidoglycan/LPS O-acetylase OafA/YrhL
MGEREAGENGTVSKKIQWLSVLRAAGLILVLIYHLFYDLLPGGFLGVDIFFTLSGYLITALAIEEFKETNSFDLFSFYTRRFSHIYPPLALTVIFSLPFASLISPDFVAGIGKQVAAAFGFVTNYFEILQGGSYEARTLPHFYVHTWFLAVEAHLYLVWGLVITAAALIFRKTRKTLKRAKYFKPCLFIAAFILAVFSYYKMAASYVPGEDTSAAYFATVTHAFPFLIGAVAATLWGIQTGLGFSFFVQKIPAVFPVAGITASLGVIFTFARNLRFNDLEVCRYGYLTVSLLTVFSIYCARVVNEKYKRKREPAVLTAVSNLSYDIFLIHWPLYIILSALIINNFWASSLTLALTLIIAALGNYAAKSVLKNRNFRMVKKPVIVFYCTAVLAAAASVAVIARAPDVSSIEERIYIGGVNEASDSIALVKNWAEAVNSKPVLYGGELNQSLTAAPPKVSPPPVSVPGAVEALGGVTVIGDSVPLGAQVSLKNNIADCYVDAKVSRFFSAGYDVMASLQSRGSLRKYVVIAMGTNPDNNYVKGVQRFIDGLEPGHRLIFITPYDGRSGDSGWAGKTAVYIRTLPEKYPFVTVGDWNAAISAKPGLLAGDKVHLGGSECIKLYTNCVIDAINAAKNASDK